MATKIIDMKYNYSNIDVTFVELTDFYDQMPELREFTQSGMPLNTSKIITTVNFIIDPMSKRLYMPCLRAHLHKYMKRFEAVEDHNTKESSFLHGYVAACQQIENAMNNPQWMEKFK